MLGDLSVYERHDYLWNKYYRKELWEMLIELVGEYEGMRLNDLCGDFSYNIALVIANLEHGTSVDELIEYLLNELEYPYDYDTYYLGVQFIDTSFTDFPF